ncbi:MULTISPECIES: nitroreductase/quinone reductase family protein [unclassified Isoptericola]|uniref:nitroreductase/quinone reductase family protein n=1 Tax=unclassified Isoptericola TaxID=2623355 RepID=UPI003651BC7B
MTFTHPQGTHGARQPRGPLLAFINRRMASRIRRKGGSAAGGDTIVLTTIGRKSGQERPVPVASFPSPDGGWYVVASAAGAANNPAWYLNLAAHPDDVTVETGGEKVAVSAAELHGEERAAAWKLVVTTAPGFAGYADKTDRELPVVHLTRR